MKIKDGQYMLFAVISMIDGVLFFISLFSFLLGFEINFRSILIFCGISFSIICISIILYFAISHFIDHEYIFDDSCIMYMKNGNVLKCWDYTNITEAIYFKFSIRTLLDQSTFGYIKITSNDGSKINIVASPKQVKIINDRYLNIKIEK